MTERKLTLNKACVYPVYSEGGPTREWQVIGYAPKGRFVRVKIGALDLSDLRSMRRHIDKAIASEIAEMRSTMTSTLDEMSAGWHAIKVASTGETPGTKP